jgi:hypothetical protein
MLAILLGTRNSTTALILSRSSCVLAFPTTCPKNLKVIYKDLKELLQPFKENVGHCLGKNVGCVIQPKWHHKPFIRAFLGDERYFLHIFRVHLNLLETIWQIQKCKSFYKAHLVQNIVD